MTSSSAPESSGHTTTNSNILTGYTPTYTQLHAQNNDHTNDSTNNSSNSNNNSSSISAGYLSPLSVQHSSVPQIRSPLAMGFTSQGNSASNSAALSARSGYSSRMRGRRDSFQQSSTAFSPILGHNNSNVSSGVANLYSHQARLSYLWPGAAGTAGSSNRNRCLSTSSIDSNASSVGLGHLTPALAAMSVQHSQQESATNSPYQSYNSSPQQNGFQHHYQPQQPSSSETSYPYHSPFTSPLSQSQGTEYDSLSMTAAEIASNIYGTTSPAHANNDMMYHSSSHYGSMSSTSAQNYNSTVRYGSSTILPLGPSLYSDTDSSRMSQHPFESSSPLSAAGPSIARSFDYNDQYQTSQGQCYGQQSQQSLGALVSNSLARPSSPDNNIVESGQQQQESQQEPQQQSKRIPSVSGPLQTVDDIHAVIGKDGKTLVYICPKCDPSKVVEFTTKSNLKRHLENKNIHNTPYERQRDQKRWQGHEKKQVSRDETTLRMRKWRNCNPEKNRFNDMRCRVYRNARKIYGEGYSEAKEEYIRTEIERRKQNMIIRNSRRQEWANQTANNNRGSVESPSSPSDSPVVSSTSGSGFPMPDTTAFMFTNQYESESSMVNSQEISAYSPFSSIPSSVQAVSKSERQKPDESKFLQDLKENRLPPRRRSRSIIHATGNNAASQSKGNSHSSINSGPTISTAPAAGAGTTPSSSVPFKSPEENPFTSLASYADSLASNYYGYSSSSTRPRRLRKQRSASGASGAFHDNQTFSSSSAIHGYPNIVGGAYSSYMDSNQQLQMLEQKYNSGSITQSILMNKNEASSQQQQQQQQQQEQSGHESLDSVVEAMEISQAMDMTTNPINPNTVASAGGIYGDRDTSAWLAPSAAYNAQNLQGSTQQDDGSKGFPFPVIRDRKEPARAAGIRLDIPPQHPLDPNQWINGMNATNSNGTADEIVGGSAASLESTTVSRQEHSPMTRSPLSAALSSPTAGGSNPTNKNHQQAGDEENTKGVEYNSNNNTNTVFSFTKSKGPCFDIFGMQSMPMPMYGQSLSSSESGFFISDTSSMTENNNYLAKEQGVARRHSTAMANLSSL
ncbi:hypothetical protein BX616_001261 [Lobosporangium transversale]|uniref:DUF3020 domain-containing protein n=1 Tax=Lobosporangium transversale TaxID=64571 RepID=A0A1Y2GUU9_9FUNG|nr:hypothetical protein BCR41DRAFT_393818 [Lobosporangium transversale]KAF9917359.1 hypothetical protein BX616_001261 [Lobosporangium transversale]ORZ24852.1 hypothetical protein BCR41DRAFT_393818 [Lobosporangium transversale]|eukprot:XP_021883833.1 hypothetical protein BCR41DRAFT_393818 [Lobosporangium transversale]